MITTIEQHFNIRRFLLLLKNMFIGQYKLFLISCGIIFGLFFIIHDYNILYQTLLIPVGIILTSMSFAEYKNSPGDLFHILIPCSTTEKYLIKFFMTTIVYIFGLLIIFLLFSLIFFFRNKTHFLFLKLLNWNLIRSYLIAHSIFFFGAIYFKKYAFIKTLFSIFLVIIVYVAFFGFIFYFFFGKPNLFNIQEINRYLVKLISKTKWNTIKEIFFYLTPIFFWILTFIRFREIEVKNGV